DLNDLMLAGTLAGVEMGLELAGVPHEKGGVQAALAYLANPQARDTNEPQSRAGP
ncbi:MAG: serine--glyoxylate aminotransferase, partial [Alphaproteobacteria bacterium]|nr:serine--glyoxylate aminotransferase [Alphaproteobacteria bacterium]